MIVEWVGFWCRCVRMEDVGWAAGGKGWMGGVRSRNHGIGKTGDWGIGAGC